MKIFAALPRFIALAAVLACLIGLTGSALTARADTTFFAEDLNFAGDTVRIMPTNSLAKRDQFLTFLDGAVTENFETQAVGVPGPYTVAMGTLSGTGPNTMMVRLAAGTLDGRFPFSGTTFFQQADEIEPLPRYSATLSLAAPQRAFGLLASDWGDSGFQGTLPTITVRYLDATTATFVVPSSVLGTQMSGSAAFFGLITDKFFDQVEIVNGTGSRTAGYDDFVVAPRIIGAAAPEPPSAALACVAGLAFCGLFAKRAPCRSFPKDRRCQRG